MHHIVDPSTGRPAEVVWRTVSVAAATCVDANVATTASIVKGEMSVAWLSSTQSSVQAGPRRRDGHRAGRMAGRTDGGSVNSRALWYLTRGEWDRLADPADRGGTGRYHHRLPVGAVRGGLGS